MRCLECFERGFSIYEASLEQKSELRETLFLFHKIMHEYVARLQPLWSEVFSDIHAELYRLLTEGKEVDAVRAIQVSMVLVSDNERKKLRNLLEFLKLSVDRNGVYLFETVRQYFNIYSYFNHINKRLK